MARYQTGQLPPRSPTRAPEEGPTSSLSPARTGRRRRTEREIPRVDWDDIEPELVEKWDQGQHFVILGKTGGGKTALGLALLELRRAERGASVLAIGTKARDPTLRGTGWPIINEWPPSYAQRETGHVIVWPRYTRPSQAAASNGRIIRDVLDEVMLEGAWSVFVDEMAYLVETLGLRRTLDEYWNGARSSGISMIACTQRPFWLSRSAISQGDWAASFRIHDTEDRLRAAEILGGRQRYVDVIGDLRNTGGKHEFVLVRISTDEAVITELPSSALVSTG